MTLFKEVNLFPAKLFQSNTKSKHGGKNFFYVFISKKYLEPKKSVLNVNVDDSKWEKQFFFK